LSHNVGVQEDTVLNYPLTLSFKIIAIAPQIKVTDATGETVLYVRQKALALREDVRIFADEQQQQQLYQLNADRILDFSANYRIRTAAGEDLGNIRRRGMRSLWNATYEVAGTNGSGNASGTGNGHDLVTIHEENAWVKVLDGLAGELPVIGMFLPMFINPAYLADRDGQTLLRMKKEPAFLEGKFTIEKKADFPESDEALLLASLLMMILLERQRG
jgi:uncharacterized protein YxjI